MVNRSGTVSVLKVRLAGIVRVVSTTPGRIEPQGEPMPGKLPAPLKFPCSAPVGDPEPRRQGRRDAVARQPEVGAGAADERELHERSG